MKQLKVLFFVAILVLCVGSQVFGQVSWFATKYQSNSVRSDGPEPIELVWGYGQRIKIVGFNIYKDTLNIKPEKPFVTLDKDSVSHYKKEGWDNTAYLPDKDVEFDQKYFYWVTSFDSSGAENETWFRSHSHFAEMTPPINVQGQRLSDGTIKWTWQQNKPDAKMFYIRNSITSGRIGTVERQTEWIGPSDVTSVEIYRNVSGYEHGVLGDGRSDLSELGHILNSKSTDVSIKSNVLREYNLGQNYPNPFNPKTIIDYSIAKDDHTKITVHNMRGQKITTLVDEQKNAGNYSVNFNAENLESGIYFYRLETNNYIKSKRMVLMK